MHAQANLKTTSVQKSISEYIQVPSNSFAYQNTRVMTRWVAVVFQVGVLDFAGVETDPKSTCRPDP